MHSHEVTAKPSSGVSSIAKFTNYLVSRLEHLPYAHRIEVVGVIPWQPLFSDELG